MYILLFPCVMLLWFLCILIKDRRSLWSGFTLFCFLFSVLFSIAFICIRYETYISEHVWLFYTISGCGLLFLFTLGIFPFLFVITYFIQGIKLIRYEGFSFHNMLSVLFSVLIVIYIFFFPYILQIQMHLIFRIIISIVSFSVIYLFMIFAIYYLSAFVNRFHILKRHRLDYIVILGCGIIGEKITPLLKGRIDKALELFRYNPKAKIICSGGQGEGEDIAESEAMQKYLLECGIPQDKILVENKSTTTEENLLFSEKLMEDNTSFALVTTQYHVLRALLIARELGLYCIGYGSKTKLYFALNAEIREFAGYLSLSKQKHLKVLFVYTIFAICINMITYLFT